MSSLDFFTSFCTKPLNSCNQLSTSAISFGGYPQEVGDKMMRKQNSKILLCVLSVTALFILMFPYFPATADSSAGWGIAELIEHEDLSMHETKK